ncbi:MAG: hypothetical protein IT368_03690, partial [Candidatus Hydrogenedentes bacterium]|nr:hypothetical protein [Candidatus Hydrogenedentota bacterium]
MMRSGEPGFSFTRCLVSGLAVLLLQSIASAQYEYPTRLFFSEIFPEITGTTAYYEIDNAIANDGLMNHFTIYAPSGTYFVTGNEFFLERLHEMEVTPRLEQLKESEAYVDGVKAAGTSAYHSVKTLITEPVETLSNVPRGVTRLFGNVIRGTKTERMTNTEDERYKQAIGFSKAKRSIAYELGIDPYTSNLTIQALLDDLAWASFAGGMSLTVVQALAIPAPVNLGVGIGTTPARIAQIVRDESPQGIQKRVMERFAEVGVGSAETEQFLENEWISPTKRLQIAESLVDLKSVEGVALFAGYAVQAASEEEARFMQRTAELLAAIDGRFEPFKRLQMAAGRPVAE